MKSLKTIFILLLLSSAISAVIYYLTAGTITATLTDIIGEIAVVAVPVFIFLLFVYLIARSIGKKVKGNKKSLPNQEGPNAV
jgi:hypothetical protein